MDVASGEYGSAIVSKLAKEASFVNRRGNFVELEKPEKGQSTPFWTQLSTLTKRSLFITFQDKVIFVIFCPSKF
jgi:hypothetical protein